MAEPGNARDIAIGVEPVVAVASRGSERPVARLPRAECVCGDAGAQDRRARVVDWPGREPAEKPHSLFFFGADHTESGVYRL